MSVVLALNYPGHTSSAALFKDGRLLAACAQERYDRKKKSSAFPSDAIRDCLKIGGLALKDVECIARCYDPGLLLDYRQKAKNANEVYRVDKLLDKLNKNIFEYLDIDEIPQLFFRHHLCHLASAYYPSGFQESLLISHDGVGEVQTQSVGIGKQGVIETISPNIDHPNSLGHMYQAITHYLGWQTGDEGIVMGLAAYGDANAKITQNGRSYLDVFEEIIIQDNDNSFVINQDWFAYDYVRDKWVSDLFVDTFGQRRAKDGTIETNHENIAAALQKRLCAVVENQLRHYQKATGARHLCIAGGVGLNCSLNGFVQTLDLFDEIFVTPASGDDGTPIGAGYLASAQILGLQKPRKMHNFYSGSRYSDEDVAASLDEAGVDYERLENHTKVAEILAAGKVVGWFQGGSEFGPRALGARSILAHPFSDEMRDFVNKEVKFREMFRPLAPAVLEEDQDIFFDLDQCSPHMLIACDVREDKRAKIPAVVHVDGSARAQTVTEEGNSDFFELLQAFKKKTGIGVLLNTSFNVKGQPIVNSPEDAIKTFLNTKIDALCIGSFLVQKV